MAAANCEVTVKTVPSMLIASIHMQAAYRDCGKAFGQLGRAIGRHICGPGFLLHHDGEYKENDASFDVCFPIRKKVQAKGDIKVRELEEGRFLSLLHQGPYEEIGRSYEEIIKAMNARRAPIDLPIREIYLKGPGMIFKGNPQKYLTEIQMKLTEVSSD